MTVAVANTKPTRPRARTTWPSPVAVGAPVEKDAVMLEPLGVDPTRPPAAAFPVMPVFTVASLVAATAPRA